MKAFVRRARLALLATAANFVISLLYSRFSSGNGICPAVTMQLVIFFAGAYGSETEAIISSVSAVLCLDYYFLPPLHTLRLQDPQDFVALLVFVATSLVASRLSTRLRHQRDQLAASRSQIEKQYALSRAMLLGAEVDDFRRLVVNKLIELFKLDQAVLFEIASGRTYSSDSPSAISDEQMKHVAVYGSIDIRRENSTTIIPIMLGNRIYGSLGFVGGPLSEATLQAVANNVAIGLAQAQAQEANSRAVAIRKGEELKSVLIDALAHDLKTPLTAMEASVSMLSHPESVTDAQRADLVEVISQEVQGLKRLVSEAIHLARIDAERLRLKLVSISVEDLVRDAVASLGDRVASSQITIHAPGQPTHAFVDKELMTQVLKQLIDNAIKYSPAGAAIEVTLTDQGQGVAIAVRDHGYGLNEVERGRVFDKFYRGRYDRSAIQGTGMGLAIAKEIVEAHGGSITLESEFGQGSEFVIQLKNKPELDSGHDSPDSPSWTDTSAQNPPPIETVISIASRSEG